MRQIAHRTVTAVRRWAGRVSLTDAIAISALLLSAYNTWDAQLRPPARSLRVASIHEELRPTGDGDLMVLHARLAIMNRGELPEILLSQALSFGRNAPGLAFGANSVMPTASGGAVAVPPQEVRMLELEMPFRVNELFAWRTNPGLFEGLKAHFGVALYVLDSEGDQISTYLPLGEIWFKDDGSIAQTSGRRATASLLGDAKGSVRWQASSEN